MTFKHAYAVVSTNFDLEPVLQQYVETYPDVRDFFQYRIVFECAGEHHPDSKSYLIVFDHKPGGRNPEWTEFLKSYCLVNKLVFEAQPHGNVFPNIGPQLKAQLGKK